MAVRRVDLEEHPLDHHHVGPQLVEKRLQVAPQGGEALRERFSGRGGEMSVSNRDEVPPYQAHGSVPATGQTGVHSQGEHAFEATIPFAEGGGTSGLDQLEYLVGDVEVRVHVLHVVVVLQEVHEV